MTLCYRNLTIQYTINISLLKHIDQVIIHYKVQLQVVQQLVEYLQDSTAEKDQILSVYLTLSWSIITIIVKEYR